MKTRAEAVAYLNHMGFHAKERDWSLGTTIGIFSGSGQLSPTLKIYRKMVYIYARDELWSIYNPKIIPNWLCPCQMNDDCHSNRHVMQPLRY